jgi:hypothetical protein
MTEQRTYLRIYDPGHSWLIVPREELVEAGVLNKITPYSPHTGELYYLEEDCDMWTFVESLKASGVEVLIEDEHVDDFEQYLNDLTFDRFDN